MWDGEGRVHVVTVVCSDCNGSLLALAACCPFAPGSTVAMLLAHAPSFCGCHDLSLFLNTIIINLSHRHRRITGRHHTAARGV